MAPHQVDADQGAARLADNRGQRRAGNAQRRETPNQPKIGIRIPVTRLMTAPDA